MCHSVVEEGHIRKLWLLGKARPKQSVVVWGTFLWESRLLDYSTLERSSSPPNFREILILHVVVLAIVLTV